LQGAPVMLVEMSTHDAMSAIHRFTPKLNIHDTNRVKIAGKCQEEIARFTFIAPTTSRLPFFLPHILLSVACQWTTTSHTLISMNSCVEPKPVIPALTNLVPSGLMI
jgi:hypothetical protein